MTAKLDALRLAALRLDELRDAEWLTERAWVSAKAACERAEADYEEALEVANQRVVARS
jgi:hypothetical protein